MTTKKQATERWVSQFNAIPTSMIEALWVHLGEHEGTGWQELTRPRVGNLVYYDPLEETGEIISVDREKEEFTIRLDSNIVVFAKEDDFSTDPEATLPMWGTMWSFGDMCDNYWLEKQDGIEIMSEHGFRVYEHEEFGYFFGIDGAGYGFYEEHWIPLYEARGLQWHDKEMVKEEASTSPKQKARNRDDYGAR